MATALIQEKLTESVIGAFFEVYNHLGYGFLEHIYVMAMERELLSRNHKVSREVGVTVHYKGMPLGSQRLDMIVESVLIVEVKATAELHKAAKRQLLSYLKGTALPVGLLLHFGPEATFHRVVQNPAVHPRDPRKSA